jgi:hypothetical protein
MQERRFIMHKALQTLLSFLIGALLIVAAPLAAEAAANPITPTTSPSTIVATPTTPPASYLQAVTTLQQNKYGENEIKSFVYQVFSLFDRHAEISQLFLLFAEDVNMVVPEAKITSHQEFEKWYKEIGARYQSNTHTIERIDVQIPVKGDYRVDLTVNWQAMGVDGKYTAFKSRQQWKIVDGGGYWPRIVSYIVEPAR